MPQKIILKYDGPLDIATGRSRMETNWRNKETTWGQLVERMSTTHRTAETQAEYNSSKKSRQDEIKDIGGFVGGYLSGGNRKSGSVQHRGFLTLDLDYANTDFWADFTLTYGNAALIYSTHKHEPDSPRLRLIIPFNRIVQPDEYEAVSRRIAGVLGIELFDPTTFQPERLMYWPSTSKDAEYIFEYQDGEWLDVDAVLASYHDWKDTSEWPVSEKVDKILHRSMIKQGDPLEKHGVVGAFCRTFTIHEAIETFLSDVYSPNDMEGRYTYKEGSTAAGLITYDDKYAYSHHGTDPTSGKLCNAFDLVRLHKFGLKDEDARADTPSNKLPSYIEMIDFAVKDKKVKQLLGVERLKGAVTEFTGEQEEKQVDIKWLEGLEVDRKGNYYGTIDNILLILENDPAFKDKIAYDDFEKCEVATKALPWREIDAMTRRLIDKDDSNIRYHLEKYYGISNLAKTRDAMEVLSIKTSFHPVRDYLRSVEWDGEERVNTLLVDYQGAENNEYTQMVTRKWLVAAVARIFNPGVKFDHVLSLIGEQGLKKSSLIAALGKQWFTDSFSTIEGKESFEQLQGVWLVEIAEMAALAKAEVEKIKHFITKRDDRYRVAFGRRTEKFPRQCVFAVTSNKFDFMKDTTGGRRFWPVRVNVNSPNKDVFKDLSESEIAQVWAEAVHMYRKKETLYLPDSMIAVATQIQKDHTEEHPWTGLINQYLYTKLPVGWTRMNMYERRSFLAGNDELIPEGTINRTRVCLLEIWSECIKGKDTIDERSASAIRGIMSNMEGWEEQIKPVKFSLYGTQRKCYFRIEVNVEIEVTNKVTTRLQEVDF